MTEGGCKRRRCACAVEPDFRSRYSAGELRLHGADIHRECVDLLVNLFGLIGDARLPTRSTLPTALETLTTFDDADVRLLAISCAACVCCSTAVAMRTEKRSILRIVWDMP